MLNLSKVLYFMPYRDMTYVVFGREDKIILDQTMDEINSLILKARFTDYIASMPDVDRTPL